MLRSKADWLLAKKPTKYFLNLEKAKFNKKCIHRLQNEEGTGEITGQKKSKNILQIITENFIWGKKK